MTTSTKLHQFGSKGSSAAANPFARALAETEKSYTKQPSTKPLNPFTEALARAGGAMPQLPESNAAWQRQQQEILERQRKKEALRKKLHDQVNPVDMQDVFNAREKQVTQEIEQLRQDLLLLSKEIILFHKEIEVPVHMPISHPGQSGKYYFSFYKQLRRFVLLWIQEVKSARTWATQFKTKQKKKTRAGLKIQGAGYEQTKTVYDMAHHERSTTYSGG